MWIITDGELVFVRRRSDTLVPATKRGIPSGTHVFASEGEAQGEIELWRRLGFWPGFATDARPKQISLTW
jgi:hypothetical protein